MMNSFATAVLDNLFTVKTGSVEFFETFGSKIQRSFFAFIHEEDLPGLEELIEELPEKRKANYVARIKDKNGEYQLMLLKLSIVNISGNDYIETYFIDILRTNDLYDNAEERYTLARQHLMNMEMICFEYSPNKKKFELFVYSLNQTIPLFNGEFTQWQHQAAEEKLVPEDQAETFNSLCFDIESCKENFTYKIKSALFTKGETIEENIIRCSTVMTSLGTTYVVGTITSVVNNTTLSVENTFIRSYKDPMTGVLNKASIVRFIKNRITNLQLDESIVIAILDLDNF
ncbi:MAG: hypothetical protein IJ736_13020, partial [Firmicutes bacterium]|nr:hypothetical protein [Bacillota bacterium]